MSNTAGNSPPLSTSSPAKRIFIVGTLKYSVFGLFMLFIWLLWGDFIWTLLDGQLPNILPLKLKDLGASDTVMVFLNKTLAYAVTFIFAPIISFRSDRYRSRWGRRIPFLFWSTPFVGLFLILIGYYDSVTNWFLGTREIITFLGWPLDRAFITLLIFAALLIGFDIANIFVNTVYWYLFNDFVPEQNLSRFMSFFRMKGILSKMIYSKYIFPVSLEYFREVFVIGGIAYVTGFILMCIFIREGKYPPPPENTDKKVGLFSDIKTFCKECFTHRFYWYFFLTSTFSFLASQALVFSVLRNRDSLHLNLQDIGNIVFYTAPISFLLQYPSGWLADKYHPLRIYLAASLLVICSNMAECVFIFKDFGPADNLTLLYAISFISVPFFAIQDAAGIPMFMRLLPRERYGQFSSANAMIRSFAMIFGSILAALFMEHAGTFSAKDYFTGTGGITISACEKPDSLWKEEPVGPFTVNSNDRHKNGWIMVPGATAVKIFFGKISTETGWGHLKTGAHDDWSGTFNAVYSGVSKDSCITLDLYNHPLVRGNFTITKIAYRGEKNGSVSYSGNLWNSDTSAYMLSGRIVDENKKAGIPGVSVRFISVNGERTQTPAEVTTDANGNWAQSGFCAKAGFRLIMYKEQIDGKWHINVPDRIFSANTNEINVTATWASASGMVWTEEEVYDNKKRNAIEAWFMKWGGLFSEDGMDGPSERVPWTVHFGNDWDRTGSITVPGALAVKVFFSEIKTESGWDHLITDASHSDDWSGSFENIYSDVK